MFAYAENDEPFAPATSRDQEDLRWYFTEAAGELGPGSNYPGMVLRIALGGGPPPAPRCEPDPFGLAAAERARRIEGLLAALPKEDVRVLEACLGEEPPEDLKGFGRAAALVPDLDRAVAAWRASHTTRSLLDWLSRLHRRLDEPGYRALVRVLQAEAEQRLVLALLSYRDARRKGARHG